MSIQPTAPTTVGGTEQPLIKYPLPDSGWRTHVQMAKEKMERVQRLVNS